MAQISGDILGQIYARDFKMIDQSDLIVSLVPELPDGRPALSSGVERELQHAFEAGKEVYVVWRCGATPSPFVTKDRDAGFPRCGGGDRTLSAEELHCRRGCSDACGAISPVVSGTDMPVVTVYCSSSRDVDQVYFEAARELGRGMAQRGWPLVYGGNDLGLMGALANATRDAGGKVIGVTPQFLVDEGIADLRCDELIVTATMRERKAIMENRADAFVTLPGGLGTLEEIFEIIVGRVLGVHSKPIVLLNINGFYDPLLAMIDHGDRAAVH